MEGLGAATNEEFKGHFLKNNVIEVNNRRFKEISTDTKKKVLKGLAIAAAAVLAVAAVITLVVGVIFLINPLGFGVGNAIGAGVTAGSAAIAAFAVKAAAFAGANALYITIAGAATLGATGVGSALFVIIKRLKNRSEKPENPRPEESRRTISNSRELTTSVPNAARFEARQFIERAFQPASEFTTQDYYAYQEHLNQYIELTRGASQNEAQVREAFQETWNTYTAMDRRALLSARRFIAQSQLEGKKFNAEDRTSYNQDMEKVIADNNLESLRDKVKAAYDFAWQEIQHSV